MEKGLIVRLQKNQWEIITERLKGKVNNYLAENIIGFGERGQNMSWALVPVRTAGYFELNVLIFMHMVVC